MACAEFAADCTKTRLLETTAGPLLINFDGQVNPSPTGTFTIVVH